MNGTKSIALYARESTKWQAENGYNLEDQKKRMQLYVQATFEENTYTINVYEEAGASAKTLDRPMMKQLIEDVNANKITHCVVYSIDRLSRTITDLIEFVELLQKKNVVLLSVSEKIDTETPQGRFFLQLMGLLAQLERENISERTKRSLLESASQGNYSKAGVPYGYIKENGSKVIKIDKDKSEVIRYIFVEIGKGNSGSAVARQLRENKILKDNWNDSRVYDIVRNPIYKGTYTVQGKEFENHTEPIVSEEEWNRANACIASIKPVSKHPYIYKGKIFCEKCGRLMTGTSSYNCRKKIYIYYQCIHCNIKISQNRISDGIADFINLHERNTIHSNMKKALKKAGKKSDYETIYNTKMTDILYSEDIEAEAAALKENGTPDKMIGVYLNYANKIKEFEFLKVNTDMKTKYINKYLDKATVDENKHVKPEGINQKKKTKIEALVGQNQPTGK